MFYCLDLVDLMLLFCRMLFPLCIHCRSVHYNVSGWCWMLTTLHAVDVVIVLILLGLWGRRSRWKSGIWQQRLYFWHFPTWLCHHKKQCFFSPAVQWGTLLLLQVHPLNGLFFRTTWVSRYQKGKTSLDLNQQEIVGPCDAVALAGPYANNLHLAPDR